MFTKKFSAVWAFLIVFLWVSVSFAAGSNNFQQWNPNKANQKTDGQYTADSQRSGGATTGVFPATTANKLFYQTSIMAAALGESLKNKGYTVSDADFNALVAVLSNLVTQSETQYFPPTGMMTPFAGSTAPSGWLLCYGQAVSRSTYANLFAVVGTTYGVGNGSTTFNLPDLRGRAPIGIDNLGGTAASRVAAATSAGQSGGLEKQNLAHTHTTASHTLIEAEIPNHDHDIQGSYGYYGMSGQTSLVLAEIGGRTQKTGGGQGHTHGDTGSGGSATQSTMDPYLAMSYIIKY